MNSFYKFNIIDLIDTIKDLNKTGLSCQDKWKETFENKLELLIIKHNIKLNKGENKRRSFYNQKLKTLKELRVNGDKYVKLRKSTLPIPHKEFDNCKIKVEEYLYLLDYFKLYFKEEEGFKDFYFLFITYSNYLNTIYYFL